MEGQNRVTPAAWPDVQEQPLPVFPVGVFPDFCRDLVLAASQSLAVPIDYCAFAVLGVLSSAAVGRFVVKAANEHAEAIQLYLGLAGESGTRKTSCINLFREPLSNWLAVERRKDAEIGEVWQDKRDALTRQLERLKKADTPDLREVERVRQEIQALTPPPRHEVFLSDITPEAVASGRQSRGGNAIILSDEGQSLNALMGRSYVRSGGAANIDVFLQGFDNGQVSVERKQAGSINLERASISMAVGLQPRFLDELAADATLGDRGFTPRMLFFCPDTSQPMCVRGLPKVPDSLLAQWSTRVCNIARRHRWREGQPIVQFPAPEILHVSSDGYGLVEDLWQRVEDRRLTDFESASLRSWAGKAHGKAMRLAGLLALLKNPDASCVDVVDCEVAVRLIEQYFFPHAQRVLGGRNALSGKARNILDYVKTGPCFNKSEVFQRFRGQTVFRGGDGKNKFDGCISELERGGYIRQVPQEKGQAGRPPLLYEVNPVFRGDAS